jgi:hypothetical protein
MRRGQGSGDRSQGEKRGIATKSHKKTQKGKKRRFYHGGTEEEGERRGSRLG